MIRSLSSSIYLLHISSCPSNNAALEKLAFVNGGGSYKCFFDDACKLKRRVEDNIERQSSVVETSNTGEQQCGPIQR